MLDAHELIRRVQQRLAELDYKVGKPDGIAGRKTRAAVRRYQAEKGLPVDGKIDQNLLNHLNRVALAPQMAPPQLKPIRQGKSGLPVYQEGTRYIYSDGRVETVVGLEGNLVRWQSNRDEEITTFRNFILPEVTWSKDGERGWRTVTGEHDALWPLVSGEELSFVSKVQILHDARPGNRSAVIESWKCVVGESARLSVVAGYFQTIKVTCRRAGMDDLPELRRVWFYAPSIGHFVRTNDFNKIEDSDRHVELVAISPPSAHWPPAAQAGLGWALSHALESGDEGTAYPWRSSAVETQVTIRPLRSFERGDGKRCRNFMQTWVSQGERFDYPGTACRTVAGTWEIPGLKSSLPGLASAEPDS